MNKIDEIKDLESLNKAILVLSKQTNSFKKIAVYFNDNLRKIIFMTADEVAKKIGISQGTITRFCNFLGYKGYNDFLKKLQLFLQDSSTAVERYQYIENDTDINKMILVEHDNLHILAQIFKKTEFVDMANKINNAKKVYLISSKLSSVLVDYMYELLSIIREDVIKVLPGTVEWDNIELANNSDNIVFSIMYPRYIHDLIFKLESLKEKDFQIIGITDNAISPLHNYGELVIDIPFSNFSVFDCYSSPMLFINILLREVSIRCNSSGLRLEKIEEIQKRENIYHKVFK